MSEVVYILCALSALGCGILLLRNYLRARTRLVFWMLFCFFGLAIANGLLFIDLVVLPTAVDLTWVRSGVTLVALSGLLYAFVWEATA
jgi:hypothetical protein